MMYGIVMSKTSIKCFICKLFFDGDKNNWRFYKGKPICEKCRQKILDKEL